MNYVKILSTNKVRGEVEVIYYPQSAIVGGAPTWFLGPSVLPIRLNADGTMPTGKDLMDWLRQSIPFMTLELEEKARAGAEFDMSELDLFVGQPLGFDAPAAFQRLTQAMPVSKLV